MRLRHIPLPLRSRLGNQSIRSGVEGEKDEVATRKKHKKACALKNLPDPVLGRVASGKGQHGRKVAVLKTDHTGTGPARTDPDNTGVEAGRDTALSCPRQIRTTLYSPNRRQVESQRILSLPPHGLNGALEMDPDPVSSAGLETELPGVPANGLAIAFTRPQGNRGASMLAPHGAGEAHEMAPQSVALTIRVDNELVDLEHLSLSRLVPIRITDDESGCLAMNNGLEETVGAVSLQALEIEKGLIGGGFAVLLHTLVGLHIELGQSRNIALGHWKEGYIRVFGRSPLRIRGRGMGLFPAFGG